MTVGRRRSTGRSSTATSRWGVTALQAVEEMDAGPIWATRAIRALGRAALRKSAVYNGPVADAAIELIREVVAKAADPTFRPEPLDYRRADVIGRLRPAMRQADREFSWSDATDTILRRIAAADGSPGVRTTLGGVPVSVFDARRGPALPGPPGTIVRRRHGAVLVRTGDGGVWVGQVRADGAVKLPATMALDLASTTCRRCCRPSTESTDEAGRRELSYQRHGDVGVLRFDFYNGAMSTGQCRRLVAALRHAISAAHQGARDPRRRRVLQRHPPQRHPRRPLTGAGGVAQHQRHRRRVPGDHHVHQPARRQRRSAPTPAPAG